MALPIRNARTNPYGKYVSAFFNYRTELLPLDSFNFGFLRVASTLSFWAFLVGGTYHVLQKYTETQHWNNETSYKAFVGGATANYSQLRLYPKDAPQHLEAITPMKNFVPVRPDMIFGANDKWLRNECIHTRSLVEARNLEDAIDSSLMQGGPKYNLHRYVKAASVDDYEAIRLKALFNLAAATYYEGRAPGLFQPLAYQVKLDEATKSSII